MARFHIGGDGDVSGSDEGFETITGVSDSAAGVGSTQARPGLSSSDSTATPGKKICVACGRNVAGEKRFKDGEGRYWCYECGVEDHIRKHPEEGIACPECGDKFAPSKLVEFDGQRFCQPCAEKRRIRKKREEARIAAAAAEAASQEFRHKLFVTVIAILVVLAIAIAVWRVMR